jgi:DNA modification methylase
MSVRILIGDCREKLRGLPDASVHCCVTSPPYFGLRDYGHEGQMGLEPTPHEFVAGMVEVFREVRRVLRDDGTLWLNIGDSYCNTPAGNKPGTLKSCSGLSNSSENLEKRKGNLRDNSRLPGVKTKDLIGIPWMLAFALRADGWFLRQDIIWSKPNPMPESVRDRCTKAHEYLFLLSKSQRYYFDQDAIAEAAVYGGDELGILRGDKSRAEAMGRKPSGNEAEAVRRRESKKRGEFNGKTNALEGREAFRAIRDTRNKRSVWEVATQPFSEAHFATYPPALIEPCIKAGCPQGGTVLDPFFGAGTTGLVADRLQRNCVGIELNPEYAALAEKRIHGDAPLLAEVA